MAQIRKKMKMTFEYNYVGPTYGKGTVSGTFLNGSISCGGKFITVESASCNRFPTGDEAEEWFLHQKSFGASRLVEIMVHHQDIVVYEKVETLWEWLGRLRKNMPRVGDWYTDYFREHFLHIFRDVLISLREIHSSNKFHGNLCEGIFITEKGFGKLSNMKKVGKYRDIARNQEKDVKDIIILIKKAIGFPRLYNSVVAADGLSGIPEVDDLCLYQLKSWNYAPGIANWALRPVLFFNKQEQIRFLITVNHAYWGHDSPFREYMQENLTQYFSSKWHRKLYRDLYLHTVYLYKKTSYQTPDSVVRFYRNCHEHYYYQVLLPHQIGVPARSPDLLARYLRYLKGVSPRQSHIHDEILKHVPTCLKETVKMMTAITSPTSIRAYDNCAALWISHHMGW